MHALAALGVARAGPAPLSHRAAVAVECWNFCAGWAPERWPVFAALHDVDDWHALAELMLAIKHAQEAEHANRIAQVPPHR